MPRPRRAGIQNPKKSIYIFCEGKKTEPKYFDDYISDLSFPFRLVKVATVHSDHTDLVGLVEEAKQHRRTSGSVIDDYWVVVDKDGYTKHPEGFSNAKDSNINIAFSSICFEYWLFLHYKYSTKDSMKCENIIKKMLMKHITNYEKGGDHIYSMVRDRTSTAIKNAQKVQKYWKDSSDKRIYELSPYTDVNILVSALRAYKDELEKELQENHLL